MVSFRVMIEYIIYNTSYIYIMCISYISYRIVSYRIISYHIISSWNKHSCELVWPCFYGPQEWFASPVNHHQYPSVQVVKSISSMVAQAGAEKSCDIVIHTIYINLYSQYHYIDLILIWYVFIVFISRFTIIYIQLQHTLYSYVFSSAFACFDPAVLFPFGQS